MLHVVLSWLPLYFVKCHCVFCWMSMCVFAECLFVFVNATVYFVNFTVCFVKWHCIRRLSNVTMCFVWVTIFITKCAIWLSRHSAALNVIRCTSLRVTVCYVCCLVTMWLLLMLLRVTVFAMWAIWYKLFLL